MTVSIVPERPPILDGIDRQGVCAVCGAVVETDGEIEDSNGWRWFSDGRGGLLPLCPTCPVPSEIAKRVAKAGR